MTTIEDVQGAIAAIVAARMQSAQRSEYDWKVCVRAVGAADAVFRTVAVAGTPRTYAQAVIDRLAALRDSYNDPDGEYTNGSSDIGSTVADIERLARTLA